MTVWQYFVLAVFGLVWGSFLNVAIYRLPQMAIGGGVRGLSFFAWPLSFCPRCENPIRPRDNIPLISFAILGGRCGCPRRERISARYPIVESLGAIAMMAAVWRFGLTLDAAFVVFFASALIIIAAVDLEHLQVPDAIVFPLAAIGLAANIGGRFAPFESAVIGVVGGFGGLFAVACFFKLLMRKEAMGFGDIKLFAALGGWTGWEFLPFILFGASGLGLIFAAAQFMLPKKSKMRRRLAKGYFPFGFFLSLTAAAALFFGDELLSAILP